MADWSTPADLRKQLLRPWDRGELLACMVAPGELFPLRLALRGPRSGELSDRVDEARNWVLQLQQGAAAGYRLVQREVRHRVIGQNSLPEQAWVDTLDDALRLRFRFLDPGHVPWAPGADPDYTVVQQAFAALGPAVSRVFVTENEVNFLAFPPVADSLVIFGAGYGFDMLAQAGWLTRCALHYWGDIDTHGFAILDQLRAHFPHAQSFLMDRDTLLAHRPQWTDEPQPTLRDLSRLNDDERRLYDDLRWLRLHDQPVRLEQERIAFGCIERALMQHL